MFDFFSQFSLLRSIDDASHDGLFYIDVTINPSDGNGSFFQLYKQLKTRGYIGASRIKHMNATGDPTLLPSSLNHYKGCFLSYSTSGLLTA